ncbi:LuxR C-terminal-related transcriptional regulator [Streptomyces sp. NPDC001348]
MSVPTPGLQWPLVGREAESEAFAHAFAGGLGQGWVVCGPTGMGKTRLADECLAYVAGQGGRTARAVASTAASGVPLGAIAPLLPPGADLADPSTLFRYVAQGLRGENGTRTAIFVDDIHLLDSASVRLIGQLLDAEAIFLICSINTSVSSPFPASALLDRGDRITRVDLGSLGFRDVSVLLERVLGGPVALRAVQALFAASAGNPLYLRELVLGALASADLGNDGEIWDLSETPLRGTPGLADLISRRMAGFGPAARPVLESLALCGPLSLEEAAELADERVLSALEEAGLVRMSTSGRRTTVTLDHPVFGDILRSKITTVRGRRLLLQRIQRVETRGSRRHEDLLNLVSWRLSATGTAPPDQLVTAASLALSLTDSAQALRLLENLQPQQRTSPALLLQGTALAYLGRLEEADEVLEAAEDVARSDAEKADAATARAQVLFWCSHRVDEAISVIGEARGKIKEPMQQRLLDISEASVLAATGEAVAGLKLLESQASPQSIPGDARQMEDAAKAVGLLYVGRVREAVQLAERAHHLGQEGMRSIAVPHPSTHLLAVVFGLAEDGQLDRARAIGEQAVRELPADTAPVIRQWLVAYLGRLEWMAGRVAQARRWYAEAAALARRQGTLQHLDDHLSALAACAALLQDTTGAEKALAARARPMSLPKQGRTDPRDVVTQAVGVAWDLATSGRVSRARTTLTFAASLARHREYVIVEAFLLNEAARLGAASTVAPRLQELAGVCDGELTAARADFAKALAARSPEALLTAADRLESMGAHLLAAEACAAASSAWRRGGQARRATAASRRSQELANLCGGVSTPMLLATGVRSADLTDREREIAVLASRGASSRAIAEELSLSVRTVDNHLQRVYVKLGVSNRSGLCNAL